jgi:hypothetical protein
MTEGKDKKRPEGTVPDDRFFGKKNTLSVKTACLLF